MTTAPSRQYLFVDQSANATSDPVQLTYPNGKALVTAWSPSNSWASATVQLFYLAPDGTEVPVSLAGTVVSYTANQGLEISGFPYGEQLVAVLSNAGGGTDVTVMVEGVAGS